MVNRNGTEAGMLGVPPVCVRKAGRAIAAVVAFMLAGAAQAEPLLGVGNFTGQGSASTTYDRFTLGYRFDAVANTNVVSLGIWDFENNGLAEAHAVGLWDNAGTLLSSVTVASGTGVLLDGGYRWVDLANGVSLISGRTYTVAAYYDSTNDDLVADLVAAVSVDSRIHLQGSVERAGSSLAFATQMAHPYPGPFSYGGGNIRLNDPSIVPEPASLALLGLGLAGLGFTRRRKQQAG